MGSKKHTKKYPPFGITLIYLNAEIMPEIHLDLHFTVSLSLSLSAVSCDGHLNVSVHVYVAYMRQTDPACELIASH